MIQFTDTWREAQIHEEIIALIQSQKEKAIFEMLNPKLNLDGNQWCCIWGEMPETYIVGFGDSPALAISDFYSSYFTSKISIVK
jgi:hypothetical protein